ncbi:hypothetical protein KCP78_06580 [Salmonella enterica subsp. enterica]|nr:hypothetical protein KCP78_06580 [Salmonella enterica subsp. enterica]
MNGSVGNVFREAAFARFPTAHTGATGSLRRMNGVRRKPSRWYSVSQYNGALR